jgi:HlyD family secretion protein
MNETGNNKVAASSLSDRVRSLRLTETSEATGNAWWWLPWALCVAFFFLTGFLALEAFSPIDNDMVKKLATERGLNVGKSESPSTPQSSSLEISLEAKGYIVPYRLIQVSPKISGTVMKLNIKEGMQIKTDDFVIAELEDIEYQSDLSRAEGVKKAAQARWDELQKYRADEEMQAKADLDDAITQYKQMDARYVRTKLLKPRGSVSEEDYEAAESGYLSMKFRVVRLQLAYDLLRKGPRDARIAGAKAEHEQAEADLVKAKWRFDNTKVKAPIKGIILSKKTEEGNIVNPSAFSNGLSASLCEMADLHDLEVDLSIAERDISKLFKDQDCRIRAEAFPGRIYTGRISRIMPMGDRSKSSVPVRVKIDFPAVDGKGQPLAMDEQGEYLRPEMGAIVTFLNRKAPNGQK